MDHSLGDIRSVAEKYGYILVASAFLYVFTYSILKNQMAVITAVILSYLLYSQIVNRFSVLAFLLLVPGTGILAIMLGAEFTNIDNAAGLLILSGLGLLYLCVAFGDMEFIKEIITSLNKKRRLK